MKAILPPGQEHQSVWHSIKTGAYKLRGKTAFCADSLHQLCFYRFLTHRDLPCSVKRRQSVLYTRKCVYRVFIALYSFFFRYIRKVRNNRNKTADFLCCLWGRRRSHEVFSSNVPSRCAFSRNSFRRMVGTVFFIWNTPWERRHTAVRRAGCAFCCPAVIPAQIRGKDGGQLVAVRPADIGALFAEALAPDLHVGHLGALDRTVLLGIAEVAAGEEVPALEEVHAVPIFREQRVEIQTDKPFTLIGLHRLPLFGFRQRLQFSAQIEFFTLLHIHQRLRPDLADQLRGQIPRVLDACTGRLDRPEAAVSGGVPQDSRTRHWWCRRTRTDAGAGVARLPKAAR